VCREDVQKLHMEVRGLLTTGLRRYYALGSSALIGQSQSGDRYGPGPLRAP